MSCNVSALRSCHLAVTISRRHELRIHRGGGDATQRQAEGAWVVADGRTAVYTCSARSAESTVNEHRRCVRTAARARLGRCSIAGSTSATVLMDPSDRRGRASAVRDHQRPRGRRRSQARAGCRSARRVPDRPSASQRSARRSDDSRMVAFVASTVQAASASARRTPKRGSIGRRLAIALRDKRAPGRRALPPCKAGAELPQGRRRSSRVTTAPTGSYRGVWKSPPQSFQTPRSAFSARCSACLNGCTFSNGLCW